VEFVLDLLQGAGIAAAIGIRPFLPALLAGGLATGDVGLDFDGTDLAFLEEWWFLIVLAVLAVVDLVRETRGPRPELGPAFWLLLSPAAILGALYAAGSLADRDHPVVPGIIVGVLAAMLGFYAARSLFARARRRLEPDAQGALPIYGEGAALAAAGLSILFPPLAILVIAALVWLLLGGRRRAGEKYAGLRILR
jgi:uncharacterized membrane protein